LLVVRRNQLERGDYVASLGSNRNDTAQRQSARIDQNDLQLFSVVLGDRVDLREINFIVVNLIVNKFGSSKNAVQWATQFMTDRRHEPSNLGSDDIAERFERPIDLETCSRDRVTSDFLPGGTMLLASYQGRTLSIACVFERMNPSRHGRWWTSKIIIAFSAVQEDFAVLVTSQ
ncbi:hypothetical protein KCU83_g478, partial [Aureobasidium melanogenum]